jgi:methylase of polypeptide subunit release factors
LELYGTGNINMINLEENCNIDFESIQVDPFWNTGTERELKMHSIHAYPAKFPAFITTKALEYAERHSHEVKKIADIFCGCGTTAFESKRNNIEFWGCDINPVATLIAKAKSRKYRTWCLEKYLKEIIATFDSSMLEDGYYKANERLKYWFKQEQYNDLNKLKHSIEKCIPKKSDYRLFFLCAFSNILKATSVWLTKSIKPQVDPKKNPANVITVFKEQCNFMISANAESDLSGTSSTKIVTGSFLDENMKIPTVDLIVTSPPYVTSYEYADLHQLSSLWMNYAEDYRDLREGSIGSCYHEYNFNREWKRLNDAGSKIVARVFNQHKSKARSVAKYFLDMQAVAQKAYNMLNIGGMLLVVIGNTEYKGVRIDNAKHLANSLKSAGFSEVLATKRKISNKILTPFRDEKGKFTTNSSGRKIYSEEFILIGRKL